MQYPIAVTELKTTERHSHPTLDVRRKKNKGSVFDNHFEVGI